MRMAVQLEVFDILGQRVDVMVNEVLDAGSHTVRFDRADLASGVYIARSGDAGWGFGAADGVVALAAS